MKSNIYSKIEEYLKKQFPSKSLIRYEHIGDKSAELYGFMGVQIKVVENTNDIFYQIVRQ